MTARRHRLIKASPTAVWEVLADGGTLHNAGIEVLIQLRHRTMPARLARLCEEEAARPGGAGGA
ncbi:hypothetical protein ACWD2L_24120 [Streptomyces sp. NPDC002754]